MMALEGLLSHLGVQSCTSRSKVSQCPQSRMEDTGRRGMTLSLRDLVPDVAHILLPTPLAIGKQRNVTTNPDDYGQVYYCGIKSELLVRGQQSASATFFFFHKTFFYINCTKFQILANNKLSDTKICKERPLGTPPLAPELKLMLTV